MSLRRAKAAGKLQEVGPTFPRGTAVGGSLVVPPGSMSSFAGLALFDRRGSGVSGPGSPGQPQDTAGVAALETSRALRTMLADSETGDDAVGRMLRDLKANVNAATPLPRQATYMGDVATATPTAATPRASAVALQVALDQAGTVEEMQSIIANALHSGLPSSMGEALAEGEAARLRAERDAATAEMCALRSRLAAMESLVAATGGEKVRCQPA